MCRRSPPPGCTLENATRSYTFPSKITYEIIRFSLWLCVSVCVCVRERERHTHTDRQREREREKERERERERE
jgi:hypothetical protein